MFDLSQNVDFAPTPQPQLIFRWEVSSGRSRKIKAKCAPFTPCRHSLALNQRENLNIIIKLLIPSYILGALSVSQSSSSSPKIHRREMKHLGPYSSDCFLFVNKESVNKESESYDMIPDMTIEEPWVHSAPKIQGEEK